MAPWLALALTALAAAGEAMTPGWLRTDVGACILEAPPSHVEVLQRVAERAAIALPRLQADLGVTPRGPYRIVLLPVEIPTDPGIAELQAAAPAWASGFLISSRRLGAIRLAQSDRYPHDDTLSVLVHEATHMLLHDGAGGNLPRWFGEGVATFEARRWGFRDRVVYTAGLLTGALPPLSEVNRRFGASPAEARVAYAASFDFINWTVDRHGREVLPAIIRAASRRPFAEAWEEATGTPLDSSEAAWRRSSLLWHRWIPALSGSTALWSGITLLFLVATARRRARSRAIQQRWEDEDGPGPRPEQGSPGDDHRIH